MNHSIYIFGELSGGYSQYPADISYNLFQAFAGQCKAPSQLIIHRDGDLMYYNYIRILDKRRYIGISISTNGYYFTKIKSLFHIFEKVIEEMVVRGVIIHLNNKGELTSSLASLINEEAEVVMVLNSFSDQVNKIKTFSKLPAVDYSVAISSQILFGPGDEDAVIADASCRYGYTVVLKGKDYDSIRTTSYRNVLKKLNNIKDNLAKENVALKERNRKTQRQKKHFAAVVILVLVLLVCGVGLFYTNNDLKSTQAQLETAVEDIIARDSVIDSLNTNITGLNNTINDIFSCTPFKVDRFSVDSWGCEFDYFCLKDTTVTVLLKYINLTNGNTLVISRSLTFHQCLNDKRCIDGLQYDVNLASCKYYVLMIYNGRVVAGDYYQVVEPGPE